MDWRIGETSMTTKVVDSKGRIALGSRYVGRTVIVDDSDPEKIIIRPAVVIPESEAWLYRNKKALNSVRKGLAEANERRFANDAPNLDADSTIVDEQGD
jgi:hypothetical protein